MKTITILSLQCCVRCRRFGLTAVPLLVWFILLFGSSAYANDITWLANPVDNNWFNPANWSPPSVPGFLRPRALRSLDYHRGRATQSGGVGGIVFDPGAGLLLSRTALTLTPTQPMLT